MSSSGEPDMAKAGDLIGGGHGGLRAAQPPHSLAGGKLTNVHQTHATRHKMRSMLHCADQGLSKQGEVQRGSTKLNEAL